ncbi:MAG: hypothetical protein HRT87_01700 [Legionellales bacterium]|nr:hypothetical protein [Legionellales bacterium]
MEIQQNKTDMVIIPGTKPNVHNCETVRIILNGKDNIVNINNSSAKTHDKYSGLVWFGEQYTWDGRSVDKSSNPYGIIYLYDDKNEHIGTEHLMRIGRTNVGSAFFYTKGASYAEISFSSAKKHEVYMRFSVSISAPTDNTEERAQNSVINTINCLRGSADVGCQQVVNFLSYELYSNRNNKIGYYHNLENLGCTIL